VTIRVRSASFASRAVSWKTRRSGSYPAVTASLAYVSIFVSYRERECKISDRLTADPNMNEINVIVPYKYQGMWVFDDSRVGLVQEPFVAGADTWIDRVSLISRMLIGDLPWSFPVRSFLGTNIAWIGGAPRAAAIGITRPRSI